MLKPDIDGGFISVAFLSEVVEGLKHRIVGYTVLCRQEATGLREDRKQRFCMESE